MRREPGKRVTGNDSSVSFIATHRNRSPIVAYLKLSSTMMSRSNRSMWLAIAQRPSRDAMRKRFAKAGATGKLTVPIGCDWPPTKS